MLIAKGFNRKSHHTHSRSSHFNRKLTNKDSKSTSTICPISKKKKNMSKK